MAMLMAKAFSCLTGIKNVAAKTKIQRNFFWGKLHETPI